MSSTKIDPPGGVERGPIDALEVDRHRRHLGVLPPQVTHELLADRPNVPSGWLTINQFFARELNPGRRPISDQTSNVVVTALA